MEELLGKLMGQKIDVFCGGASSLRGEVIKVRDGVLHLKDGDGNTCYITISKVIAVWEVKDKEHLPGFLSKG
jgi:hypothetical protein